MIKVVVMMVVFLSNFRDLSKGKRMESCRPSLFRRGGMVRYLLRKELNGKRQSITVSLACYLYLSIGEDNESYVNYSSLSSCKYTKHRTPSS